MEDVRIKTIVRRESGKKPLVVAFTADGKEYELAVNASAVQTFAAFQRTVANEIGIWIAHSCETECLAYAAKREWRDAVADAFESGRRNPDS